MRYRGLAEIYDAENELHAMLQEDVPFFLGQLPRRRQKILELGCGTGRAAIPMAQAGHQVVGVDFDPAMLAIAQRKAKFVGLSAPNLDLRVGDALKLRLKRARQSDWVCILFNTFLAFSTLGQQDALLRTVVRHLRPGGRFYLDILQPNIYLLAQETSKGLEPNRFYAPMLDAVVIKTIDVIRDPAKQLEHITFRYRWRKGAKSHERVMRFDMTFVFPRELQLLLERHGFVLEYLWGNYDGSPVDPDSPRMIARARLVRS